MNDSIFSAQVFKTVTDKPFFENILNAYKNDIGIFKFLVFFT